LFHKDSNLKIVLIEVLILNFGFSEIYACAYTALQF